MEKAFIHLFETPIGFFFYDVNKNDIVQISNETYNSLAMKENIDSSKSSVKGLLEKNYLKKNLRTKIKQADEEYLEFLLASHIDTLLLQVTQNCNFRCDYCVYSGKYQNRTHSEKKMSEAMAFKAIDFFIEHSEDCSVLYIGFYGGEPLLEWSLVKKCIIYAETRTEKKIYFNITTNGSLLNPEISTFFVAHDVAIMISLDGPQEIHDEARMYAKSGKGTFDDVCKNVMFLANEFPNYYDENVHYNVVLHENGYKEVNDFFEKNKLFSNSLITANFITDNYLKESSSLSKQSYLEYKHEEFLTWLSYLRKIDYKPSKLLEQNFEKMVQVETRFSGVDSSKGVCYRNGNCIPGIQKLFVTTEGKFYPCERVNESLDITNIGNVKDGFDVDKIRKLSNLARYTEEECLSCWARNFCEICLSGIDEKEVSLRENILSRCDRMRKTSEELLKNYVTLKHLGYDFQAEKKEEISSYTFEAHSTCEIEENPVLYDIETPLLYLADLYPQMNMKDTSESIQKYLSNNGNTYSVFTDGLKYGDENRIIDISYIWKDLKSARERIIELNHAIKKIEQDIGPDIIILELTSGLASCSNEVVSNSGVDFQIAKSAAPPDCTVVNVPFEKYSGEEIDKIYQILNNHFFNLIDLLNIVPEKVRLEESERYHKMVYLKLNQAIVREYIHDNDLEDICSKIAMNENLGEKVREILTDERYERYEQNHC